MILHTNLCSGVLFNILRLCMMQKSAWRSSPKELHTLPYLMTFWAAVAR